MFLILWQDPSDADVSTFKYCRSVARPRIKQQYVTYWPKERNVLFLIQNWI
jgi:hypothetical protein